MILKHENVHAWHERHLKGEGPKEIAEAIGLRNSYQIICWFKKHNMKVLSPDVLREIRYKRVDWSPLAEVEVERKGRGYSLFSAKSGIILKDFIRDHPEVPVRWIARYLGVQVSSLHNIQQGNIKFRQPKIKNITTERVRELYHRYTKGERLHLLAKEDGLIPQSLKYRFKQLEKEQ